MDPLAEKYYSISPYTYCSNNPVNRIDPARREGLVVSGQPGDHKNRKHFLVNGLNRAKALASQFNKAGKGEKATWFIYNGGGKGGYSSKDLANYQKQAAKAGVNVQVVSDTKTITNYVNNKTGGDSRANDQITNFSYLGHATPGDLDIGFVDHGFINMATNKTLDVSSFNSSAFSNNAKIDLVGGCRTAVSGIFEKSVIKQFGQILSPSAVIMGSSTRIDYGDGNVDTDEELVGREGGTIITIPGEKK